ncbi:hypothetical protein SAMN05192583_3569 [Sphingomonas gellani]|uniref:Uncharacterized protein n=1 Tax=Sphingomonas gellani TaxID=1166340 RepID=A0A1H8JFX5_9SPHN|nr:hypothetical protein [Sphingomonas gellani]SEN79088.1 hypothetical protein SAMN05192583_3569 [Sphingomonas gellani]
MSQDIISLPRAYAEALVAELTRASVMLGDLAWELGGDPDTLRRHMDSLQQVDHITQIQLAVADLLRDADDPDAAVSRITLEDMAVRLRDALGGSDQNALDTVTP